jgi:hypothetical protein
VVIASPAHAMGVLSIFPALTLVLFEIGFLLFLTHAHFPYAGTLRDT